VTVAVLLPTPSAAQSNGQNIKGDAGRKSGSQPPPGAYVVVPLWFYTADAVKDQDGRELLNGSLDSSVFGGGLLVATPNTLFGGRCGFMAVVPGANNRVQGSADFDTNPGAGLTDLYVQPVSLGWTKPRADFIAAYGRYIPTGRYEDGARNNTGLGHWGRRCSSALRSI